MDSFMIARSLLDLALALHYITVRVIKAENQID